MLGEMRRLKTWLNLKTVSGVLNESLIFLVIFKIIFSTYILRWEKRLKCCYFRGKKYLKSFHLKRLQPSSDLTIVLRRFNLQSI